jgi:hypothetical protein
LGNNEQLFCNKSITFTFLKSFFAMNKIVRNSIFCFLLLFVKNINAQELDKKFVSSLISNYSKELNLSIDELPQISNAYQDRGLQYVYIQQQYLNIKVYNAIKSVIFKNNILASQEGVFIADISKKAPSYVAKISALDAINLTAKHLELAAPSNLVETENTFNINKQITFSPGGIAKRNIKAELVWVSNDDEKRIDLAWNISIDVLNSSDYWNVRINAADGSVINKNNYTVYEQNPNIKNQLQITYQNDCLENEASVSNNFYSPLAPPTTTSVTYKIIPFPYENKTAGGIVLETNPWLKAGASNDAITNGWHFDGFTDYEDTRGNNVYAYDDSLKQNVPGRFANSTTTIPSLTFSFTPDFTKQPTLTTNRLFATTNLFYWNNLLHDISYQYGFNEVAGNFQGDNMSRGGQEGDYVNAEAQDGGGTNNANFLTPPDGTNGRMQMYLWTTTTIKPDGDLDNGVVSHEFGHGISNRLTGGPANTSCLTNYEQAGEGWSDYIALMVTTNWATAKTTDGNKRRPVGNYVVNQGTNGGGIRTYPYTTNMALNPHTYADVADTTNNPQTTTSGTHVLNATEIHYIGEVWCSALWDMTWNIIQQVGYINPNIYDANGKGGNIIAMNLVIQGLKFQKCNPGFLDSRNAILKADSILYGNLYHCAIWDAFARRGMGYSATQGLSTKTTDQTEAFDVPCFTISGRVATPVLTPIKTATIWDKKSDFYWKLYDTTTGYYQFLVYKNASKTFLARKKNDVSKNNGVNSVDVLLVQRHILNTTPLNNVYKIIAADVDGNQNVNSVDVLRMKRLVLGTDSTFASTARGNRLWEFIDSSYRFPNPASPFPLKDSINIINLSIDSTNNSFVAVKLGDVNYDWNPAVARGVAVKPVELVVNSEWQVVSSELRIPITVNNFKDITAMQYTLHFDNAKYEFVGIENNQLGIDFNAKQTTRNGNIAMLWTDQNAEAKTLEEGTELFTLVLKSVNRPLSIDRSNNDGLSSIDYGLSLTDDVTDVEAWDKDFIQHNIILSNRALTTNNLPISIEQWNVSPNPTSGEIKVAITSKQNKTVSFELTDAQGKAIYKQAVELKKGSNSFALNLKQNSNITTGIYFLKAVGVEGENVKRIMVK